MSMSLFGKICEGIINEIDASKAYERFYTSIPKEDFYRITGGETNIDKFVQFILNAVRDDDYSVDKAAEIVKAFKEADPLIRQNIINGFNNGEYVSPDEIAIDLEYLKNGGVVNKNKFAKEGLVVLAKDDKWTITCTTNYLANTHYFGYTKWCTASDRAGRYDGYEMFKRYTDGGDHILIQATSNADKNETYQMEVARPNQQFSNFEYADGSYFEQVCNKEDDSISGTKVVNEIVGDILRNVLDDTEKTMFCVKQQQSQWENEEKYQAKQTKIIQIKKEKLAKEIDKKRVKLQMKADEKNAAVDTSTEKYWDEVVAKKLYENVDFLQKIYNATVKLGEVEDEQERLKIVESANFMLALDRSCVMKCTDFYVYKFRISLLEGPKWRVEDFWGDYGLRDCKLSYSLDYTRENKMLLFALTSKDRRDGAKLLKIICHTEPGDDGYNMDYSSIDGSIYGDELDNRYMAITGLKDGDIILDVKTSEIYNYGKYDPSDSRQYKPVRVMKLYGKLCFISRNGSYGTPHCLVIVNSPEDIVVEHDSDRFLVNNGGGLLLDKKEGFLQLVYRVGEPQDFRIDKEIAAKTSDCWKSDLENYIYFVFKDSTENVLHAEQGAAEFVFGNNSSDVEVYETENAITSSAKKNGKRVIIKYFPDDGNYYLEDARTGANFGKCDKYGVTEKEKLGDYNMKKYWKGYSPEQQAQMDKMWADRKADTESDGSEAMKAWDDYDTKRYPQDSYHLGKEHAAQLGKGDDYGKDHWQGRVGLKDPAAWFTPGRPRTVRTTDFDRDFYKIGTNGKPLEQPWRDEDEVPAKFAEYPEEELSEAVNKIKSLFGRMGLLEG